MGEQATAQLANAAVLSPPVESVFLQRKCDCGNHTIGGAECDSCKKEKGAGSGHTLQRAAYGSASGDEVPPIVHEVLNSPGQPLDAATRAFFEPRFGHDFSHVRVHGDAHAADSVRAVNALAYTVGQNIVFGPGLFHTRSVAGRQLLAHELAHTIQQRTTASPLPASLEMTAPQDTTEQYAEAAASAAMRSLPIASVRNEPPKLARQSELHSVTTQLTTPIPEQTEQQDQSPYVNVVPDKSTGKTSVFVNNRLVYEIEFPNAQGALTTESSWNAASRQFSLKLTVTEGAKVVMSPEAGELVTDPNVHFEVAQLSLPNGLPILVQQGQAKTVIKGLPKDPDLKRSITAVQDEETYPETTSPPPEEEHLMPEEGGGIWDAVGEYVHGALDIIGWVPVFGEVADAINAIIYLVEGRYADAAISGLSIIPIVGDMGKIGRWTVKGMKELGEKSIQHGTQEIIEGVTAKGSKEFVEQTTKKGGKELTESSIERTEKELVEREEKEAIEEASEQTAKPKESEKGAKSEGKQSKGKDEQKRKRRKKECTEAEKAILSAAKDAACKTEKSSCNVNDTIEQMMLKVAIAHACVDARTNYQRKCFTKTDPEWANHQSKIAEFRCAAYKCLMKIRNKQLAEKKRRGEIIPGASLIAAAKKPKPCQVQQVDREN
jgi:uncharacterized protein DUF4157